MPCFDEIGPQIAAATEARFQGVPMFVDFLGAEKFPDLGEARFSKNPRREIRPLVRRGVGEFSPQALRRLMPIPGKGEPIGMGCFFDCRGLAHVGILCDFASLCEWRIWGG